MERIHDLLVPDVGDFQDVPIVELLVSVGDVLTPDTPVVTLESDKASMEVPADVTGTVTEILVQEGDEVSEGSMLLRYTASEEGGAANKADGADSADVVAEAAESKTARQKVTEPAVSKPDLEPAVTGKKSLQGPAAPSVRRLARELGVDLAQVSGSGAKGRVRKEDVRAYVKQVMQRGGIPRPAMLPEPQIDFSAWGEIEPVKLSRIQKLSGSQLAGNWAKIPHVTSFDEADITELETFRKQLNAEQPVKLTLLAFLIKAAQYTLQAYTQLNSSLQGDELIVKKYYHIGFAADTPNGLVVPVIRDVDNKGVVEIAEEIRELAGLARKGRLKPEQMQGGTFTVSSLGGIGTTHFTPIINAPEVAILGLGKSAVKPVWDGDQFLPRTMLPVSLSWDHRAMDGVTAARFVTRLCQLLADFRRVIL